MGTRSGRLTGIRVLPFAPIGNWKLDELSGTTVIDYSGNGRNGAHVGTITLGNIGPLVNNKTCSSFPGLASNFISVTSNAAFNPGLGDYSWEVWIRVPSTPAATQHIYRKSDGNNAGGIQINVLTNTSIQAIIGDTTGATLTLSSTTNPALVGSWYNIVVTLDRDGNAVLYLNSVAKSTEDATGLAAVDLSTTTAVGIGARSTGASAFNGLIAEVALYNRVLTPEEIISRYRDARARIAA
jgi:hypothetical protein